MSQSTSYVLDSFSYGKSLVRLLRVVRDPKDKARHDIVEYTVQTLLYGPKLDTSYTEGDNSLVVATDSQKNTVHYLAKTLPGPDVLCPEKFALHIANHFPTKYEHIERCEVSLIAHKWSRLNVSDQKGGPDASPHPHAFIRDGEEKRVVSATAAQDGSTVKLKELKGGLKDMLVLKSSGSAFHSFLRDEFTTLREVQDRIFSTAVDVSYTFDLPKDKPLKELLAASSPSDLPDFCAVAASVRNHTLNVFATHQSASVQATLHLMCTTILSDEPTNSAVFDVEYSLPNKHYVPINLDWAKLDNLTEEDAEVFLPQADPSGLIKAKVRREVSRQTS